MLRECTAGVPPRLTLGTVTVVDEDGDVARKLAKRELALYLPVVAELDPTIEIETDLIARIRSAADRYDFDTAGALISNELLAQFALAGRPADIVEQVAALFEAGADRVEFGTPHGLDPDSGLALLGGRVLPALKEYVQ